MTGGRVQEPLDPRVVTLATGMNHAVITTLLPSGQPMTQVMWVDADDQHVLINSERHRQKVRNVQRDPRVVVTILDAVRPYCYAEVRGVVTAIVEGERARTHADALSMRYHGRPYFRPIQSERVILEITPTRVRYFDVELPDAVVSFAHQGLASALNQSDSPTGAAGHDSSRAGSERNDA